jgi:hypothetical protein
MVDNQYNSVPFYATFPEENMLISQEKELKFNLYKKTGIQNYLMAFRLFDNKIDPNFLASFRIAFLSTDMINKMTFDHVYNHETFKNPLSKTQEEIILKAILRNINSFLNELQRGRSGEQTYAEMRDAIGMIDSTYKMHMFNVYNLQHDEERVLAKNKAFIEEKIKDLLNSKAI